MKALVTVLLLFFYSVSVWAAPSKCPSVTNTNLPEDTTIFFYQKVKNKNVFYIPVAAISKGKLVNATEMLLPKEMTLYSLQDNKSLQLRFKNSLDSTETCRSIGTAKVLAAKHEVSPELYANKPLASSFNFKPEKVDVERFQASLVDPCKSTTQQKYDQDGISLCDASQLVATSHLLGQTQYWGTKQYRYDVGFGVSEWSQIQRKLKEISESCGMCSD